MQYYPDILQVGFESGRVEIIPERDDQGLYASPEFRIDGAPTRLLSNAEILYGKMFLREAEIQIRDLYDIAVSRIADPKELTVAVNWMHPQHAAGLISFQFRSRQWRRGSWASTPGTSTSWRPRLTGCLCSPGESVPPRTANGYDGKPGVSICRKRYRPIVRFRGSMSGV